MTSDENELLTKVEGQAPMGRMIRDNFWVPALLSSRLVADGAPVRVKLLGSEYVAWRASDGRVGFFEERCPHRLASLALGRNEGNALTCLFHGWKFDVEGKVLRAPTQSTNEAEFCKKVDVKRYLTREGGGLVWVYLGDPAIAPAFPAFEWTDLPADQVVVGGTVVAFNWMQGVEATIDSAHVGHLHESWVAGSQQGRDLALVKADLPLKYEIASRPYGYSAAALRPVGNGSVLARVTEFVLPWYGFIPPSADGQDGDHVVIIAVPIDDEHTTQWYVWYNTKSPVNAAIAAQYRNSMEIVKISGDATNCWGQDRELMRAGHATGFRQLIMEDFVVELSMGPVVDRTKEHLSSSDQAVVRARRMLLQAARDWEVGKRPTGSRHEEIDYGSIRSRGGVCSEQMQWGDLPY